MQRFNAVLPLEFRIQEDNTQTLQPTLPVQPLAKAASIGHINLSFDDDGVIRGINLFEHRWPHFALKLHEQADNTHPPGLSQTGYRRFRMVDPRVGFPVVSLTDAIHDSYTRSLLKDKYVLVGVTAPSLGDRYPTLYSGKNNSSTPGVAILASVLHASLNQSLIQEAPHLVVFGLALIPLFIMLLSLIRMQPRHALALSAFMMLGGVLISDALLTLTNYWIDPVPFILVALVLQPLWAWRRLEAIVHFVEDKAAMLQQFQSTERASTESTKSREVVLQYAKILDRAVASARSEIDFLAAIVDEMPDAIAIFDAQDELLLGNQKIKQLIGAQQLMAGSNLAELAQHLAIPASALMGQALPSIVRLNTSLVAQELFLKTAALQAPTGGHLRLVILTDITELRQSQTQRDRALQFLSHDMRTPVASILSLTRRGAEIAVNDQREKIVHHANALLNMMDDFILTISAEAPRYQFNQELLDNLLNDAIEQVADLAEAKHIRLVVENNAATVFVMVNTRLLVRAMVNLLFNAVKFSPSGSAIHILLICTPNTDGQDSRVNLEFSNQVDSQSTAADLIPSMPGFGLGLDFVDIVIHKHLGTITRNIPSRGMATTIITLPCTTN
jgi:signal transduction histidine kinase